MELDQGFRPARRLLAALLLLAAGLAGRAEARLLEELPYVSPDTGARTLDLYLPGMETKTRPTLVVFVHSRFWDRADRVRDITHHFARPLERLGVAVAVVRHRLAPAHPHPAAAEDVAAALAWLVDHADEYGYDASRIVLTGRSSGAHLAALIALDPRYLGAHGLSPDVLRAVVGWSGIYDLDPPEGRVRDEVLALYEAAFGDAEARRAASPIAMVRADAPIFLLLVAQHDLPGAREDAEAFSQALRDAGHPLAETFVVPGRDHMTMIDLADESNEGRRHFFTLLGLDETYGTLEEVFQTRRFWRDPPFSTDGFWRDEARVESHEADERFLATLNMLFAKPGVPRLLHPQRYHALDLLDYVERNVPGGAGGGDFLTIENVRGERVVWRRSELRELRPQIVIGLDELRSLFNFTVFYHTRRRYTWKQPEDEVWVLARPLGAFIHFPKPPPARLDPGLFGRFALEPDSFQVSESDPLAPLRDLPEPERALLTEKLHCVSCHRFRGVGARAGHLRALDGKLVGGFGLPLEEYPPKVWRRYCFEQDAVAAEIGANPVPLGEDAARLFQLVETERKR